MSAETGFDSIEGNVMEAYSFLVEKASSFVQAFDIKLDE